MEDALTQLKLNGFVVLEKLFAPGKLQVNWVVGQWLEGRFPGMERVGWERFWPERSAMLMLCILHRIWKLLYLLKNQQCQPWLAEFENIIHFYRQLINILTSSIYSRDLTFLKESTPRDLLPNKICRPYWRTSGINGPVACLKELPLVGWEQNELLGPPMFFFFVFLVPIAMATWQWNFW